jgi:hypothetical protein
MNRNSVNELTYLNPVFKKEKKEFDKTANKYPHCGKK